MDEEKEGPDYNLEDLKSFRCEFCGRGHWFHADPFSYECDECGNINYVQNFDRVASKF